VGTFPVAFYTRVVMTSFLYVKGTSSALLRNSMRITSFIYIPHLQGLDLL